MPRDGKGNVLDRGSKTVVLDPTELLVGTEIVSVPSAVVTV